MKKIPFTKMAGAGNDFLVLEERKGVNYKSLAKKMCHRTNGIGADGLILLGKAKGTDYKMRIINADGSEAEMCGNGARCLAAYIAKNKNPKKKLFSISTLAGIIQGKAKGETAIVRLSDPKNFKPEIPLTINGKKIHVHYIDTGVPHVIIYVDGLSGIDVKNIGQIVRFHKKFSPRGTNVNFVEQINSALVAARTYERGVEDETRACGTGSVAAAICSYLAAHQKVAAKKGAKMKVLTTSKEILNVTFDIDKKNINNVWLKGSAKFIAEGTYYNK